MLIAADDALNSAVGAGNETSEEVDKKFMDAIDLLSGFEKDFPFKDCRTATRKANPSAKSLSKILRALKENLHAKVNFPLFFFASKC